MSIDIFANLTASELEHANIWLENLKKDEQNRVEDILRTVLSTEFSLNINPGQQDFFGHEEKTPVAVIVAGSSIPFYFGSYGDRPRHFYPDNAAFTGHDSKYKDVNLFLLMQKHVGYLRTGLERDNRQKNLVNALKDRLPERTAITIYKYKENWTVYDYGPCMGPATLYDSSGNDVKNVLPLNPITITLFDYYDNFYQTRRHHDYDLISPGGYAGAERIIQFNRSKGTKFLALSRQYPLPRTDVKFNNSDTVRYVDIYEDTHSQKQAHIPKRQIVVPSEHPAPQPQLI